MRPAVAVRIDIRPRLVPRDEQPAKPRRQWRMPPLAIPAAGYWLGMAALTYFFANLGESPLQSAWASEPSSENVAAPSRTPPVDRAPAAAVNHDMPEPVAVVAPVEPAPSVSTPQGFEPDPETVAAARTVVAERDDEGRVTRSREEPAKREAEPATARLDQPALRLEFPEFSDSSRPTRRERAADGPRIDALFERHEDAPVRAEPAPDKAPETTRDAPSSVPSCEAAIARNNEQISIGAARGPADLSREQYAGILQNGRYLSGCAIPDRTVFEICAAVREGRAVGITVSSSPPSPSLNTCVRRAVFGLKFPASPRLDVTHTRFDAARR